MLTPGTRRTIVDVRVRSEALDKSILRGDDLHLYSRKDGPWVGIVQQVPLLFHALDRGKDSRRHNISHLAAAANSHALGEQATDDRN